MKKFLLLMFGVLLSLPAFARDFEYTYEGQTLTYTVLDEEARKVTTKAGSKDKAGNNISGSLTIPEKASDGNVEYSVTSIGEYAFFYCSGLTEIKIPNSVTSIGNGAFWGCSGLTEVVIPNSVTSIGEYAFASCTGLKGVVITNSVTSIGNYAFNSCRGIKFIYPNNLSFPFYQHGVGISYNPTGAIIEDGCIYSPDKKELYYVSVGLIGEFIIPDSVTSIGNNAFRGCSGLTKVVIPNSVTSIGEYAFCNCSGLTEVIIPNSVTSIGEYMFSNCSGLTEVVIPNSVTSIGISAFSGCSGLTEVVIPNSVTSIGEYMFSNCSGLTEVVIPDWVTSIGNYAFRYCSRLKKIVIPNSVTSIGNGVFSDCTRLTEIVIPNSVASIGSSAFSGCSGLTEVVIPSSVTSIGDNAFSYCNGLTEVVIPNSVTSIEGYTFRYCSRLKKIVIPNSVTSIGIFAFYGCSGLTEVVIPNSVTSIESYAFSDCSGLTEVVIPNSVTSIERSAFKDCRGMLKGAYPNNLSDPFYNGVGISYNPTGVIIENGLIYSSDKKQLYYASVGLTGEFIIPDSVTSIGELAFYGCGGLTAITSPKEIAPEIAENSFEGLYDNVKAIVPDNSINIYLNTNWNYFTNIETFNGVKAHKFTDDIFNYRINGENTAILMPGDYKSMNSVSIPERVVFNGKFITVNTIGQAFEDCNITTLVLPKKLEYIVAGAFKNAKLPTSDLVLPSTLKTIDNDAFNGSTLAKVVLPDGMEYIGDSAFANSSVTSINLPVAPGNSCFSNAKNLESVVFSNTVDSIAPSTFANCESLREISLPSALTTIGDNAFYESALIRVSIPSSVEEISKGAFLGIDGLKSVTIEESNFSLDLTENPFSNSVETLYLGRQWSGTFNNLSNLTSLTLGNNVSEVPDGCFRNCSKLASVKFGSDVKTIGSQAFSGCALTELVLSPATETIGAQAFEGNPFNKIAIGYNVTEIAENVFNGANSLTSVSITAKNPPMAYNNTFSYYGCPLYVVPSENDVVKDAYYNNINCWYRFDDYDLIPIEEVKIEGAEKIILQPGKSVKLSASFTPAEASLPYIFWYSTNPAIATVDCEGNVTMAASGISAQADDEELKSCKIIAKTLYSDVPAAEVTVVDSTTGLDDFEVEEIIPGATANNDIYTMQGVCIKHNATDEDIKALAPGLYIVRGKKVLVR